MMNRILTILTTLALMLAPVCNLLAQQAVPAAPETMRAYGKLPMVGAVVAIIFTGIVVYLVMIDRKVSRLEKELKS